MTKILYSPGYGAGWTTWNSGPVARKMLTYQPIIDFIEGGGKFDRAKPSATDQDLHPLLQQLAKECLDEFGEAYVCMLGASDLRVVDVSGRVRIEEYDGSESYVTSDTDGWFEV